MATFFRFIAIIIAALTVTFLVLFIIAALINYHVPDKDNVGLASKDGYWLNKYNALENR